MLQDKHQTIIGDVLLIPIVILLAPLLALAVLAFYIVPLEKRPKSNGTLPPDPYKNIPKPLVSAKAGKAERSKEVI